MQLHVFLFQRNINRQTNAHNWYIIEIMRLNLNNFDTHPAICYCLLCIKMRKWLVFCLLVIDIDLRVLSILHVERYSTCASIYIFRIAEKAWRQAITNVLLTQFDPSVAWRLFFLALNLLAGSYLTKGLTFFPEGSKDYFVFFSGGGGGVRARPILGDFIMWI